MITASLALRLASSGAAALLGAARPCRGPPPRRTRADARRVDFAGATSSRRPSTRRTRRSTPSRRRSQADDFDALAKLLGLDPAKLKADEDIDETLRGDPRGRRQAACRQALEADRRIVRHRREALAAAVPDRQGRGRQMGLRHLCRARGDRQPPRRRERAAGDRDDARLCRRAAGLCVRGSRRRRRAGIRAEADQHAKARPTGSTGRPTRSTATARRATSTRRELDDAAKGEGYFGYHFRILTGQGDNIAGGAYDYVINGNMIAGFGLIAWPAQIWRDRRQHLRRQPARHRLRDRPRPDHGPRRQIHRPLQSRRQLGSRRGLKTTTRRLSRPARCSA